MHVLYESDTYSVTHLQTAVEQDEAVHGPALSRHGFEIVDKRTGKEIYLDGSWAELFQRQINAWQQKTPTQEEVEDTLDGYTVLAQQPVRVH